MFSGGFAGAVWRCSRCPCPVSSVTLYSRGSTSAWRPATRPPRPGAAGVQTTATTQPQSTAERIAANSRAPTVLFHRPQTVTRDSWVSQDLHLTSSSSSVISRTSVCDENWADIKTEGSERTVREWKRIKPRTGERIKNQVLKRIECVCNLRWPSPRCMQQSTTTTTWCWIWAEIHSWDRELCRCAPDWAGQKPVSRFGPSRPGSRHSNARPRSIHTFEGSLPPISQPGRVAPSWENTAPNTFWLNSTICRAGGIEERHGSKLKSLSCYMFWCWKTIFLMQWRTFVTLWCFHDTHVSYSIRRVNICYNYLKCVLTFSTKDIYFVQ